MKTIGIIGGGIAGLSLLFSLTKKKSPKKVFLFSSSDFVFPCSLHSTAIVAPRGVSPGHSVLGDTIFEGFQRFRSHVEEDSPEGVIEITQLTGALSKLEAFKKRYPGGETVRKKSAFSFSEDIYLSEEKAFLVRPLEYLNWLILESRKNLEVEVIPSFVTSVSGNLIMTSDKNSYPADEIYFAGGHANSLWSPLFPGMKKTRSVQGSYLHFEGVDLGVDSFSLTLEGENLIYDQERKTLLVGSTTHESELQLPPEKELREIYETLSVRTGISLPAFHTATLKVGLREKASRREPFIVREENRTMIGGFYKNGYTLGLLMAERALSSSGHQG